MLSCKTTWTSIFYNELINWRCSPYFSYSSFENSNTGLISTRVFLGIKRDAAMRFLAMNYLQRGWKILTIYAPSFILCDLYDASWGIEMGWSPREFWFRGHRPKCRSSCWRRRGKDSGPCRISGPLREKSRHVGHTLTSSRFHNSSIAYSYPFHYP